MSAASDKARFFLEQSVPELIENERKNIFSKVSSVDAERGSRCFFITDIQVLGGDHLHHQKTL